MQSIKTRLLLLVLIMLAEAWLLWPPGGWQPNWPAAVVLAVLIGVFLLFEWNQARANRRDLVVVQRQRDALLLEQIDSLMPDAAVMAFLEGHDFIGAFDRAQVEPVFRLVRGWRAIGEEFVSVPLQKVARDLNEAATDLALKLGQYTQSQDSGQFGVKPEEDVMPAERDREEARALNEAASAFVRAHDRFVKVAHGNLAKDATAVQPIVV
ncbi:MAG: hypothetical protein QM639_02420 [Rhodocyclaceae bacterium]